MLYVLKFGGNAIRSEDNLARLSREIKELKDTGAGIILVHGGGLEINEELERRGIKPVKVDGLRVTDADTMLAVESALSALNSKVVSALRNIGLKAKGLAAAGYTISKKMPPHRTVSGETVDLGLVGEVEITKVEGLIRKANTGIIPVIYPVSADKNGVRLNVNADSMAAAIAAAVKCDEMVQITDVPGIMLDVTDPSSVQAQLTLAEVDALIRDGVITGGMVPKVEACRSAIKAGVRRVRMVNGKDPATPMFSGKAGTVITG